MEPPAGSGAPAPPAGGGAPAVPAGISAKDASALHDVLHSLGAPVQQIGSASGEVLPARPVPLAHPVEGSVYNFYTWAEQLADFTKQVIGAESTTLVANSIGSISALQAAAAELAS